MRSFKQRQFRSSRHPIRHSRLDRKSRSPPAWLASPAMPRPVRRRRFNFGGLRCAPAPFWCSQRRGKRANSAAPQTCAFDAEYGATSPRSAPQRQRGASPAPQPWQCQGGDPLPRPVTTRRPSVFSRGKARPRCRSKGAMNASSRRNQTPIKTNQLAPQRGYGELMHDLVGLHKLGHLI